MANPNPSPETRFGAERGNQPNGGKTSEQKRLEYEAAEMAASLRHKMLSSIMERIQDGEDITDYLRSDALKLFKDSEDRAHGTPTATIAGDPERPLVNKVVREIVRVKD